MTLLLSRSTGLLMVTLTLVPVTVTPAQPPSDTCGRLEFGDWRQWTSVTEEPIVSPGHSYHWVGVFVDKLAKTTYLSASAPYPQCARIVKPIYGDEEGVDVLRLTAMVKMPPGYDPEHGDWWYGVYDAAGTESRRAGRLEDCIRCHREAADTDYLFSRDVTLTLD